MHPITAMINAATAAQAEHYARKRKDAPGQRDLFSGEKRASSKTQGKLRWITLKGEDGSGGAHVQINGDGDIVKGPAALAEKGIRNLNDFDKGGSAKEKKKPKKKADKPEKQTPFERANSPENRKAVESFYDEGVGASVIDDVENGRERIIDTTAPDWDERQQQRIADRKRDRAESDRLAHEDDSAYFKRKMFEDEDDSNLRNVSQRRDYFRAVVQGIKRRESTNTWKSEEQREHNLRALEGYEHELRLLDDLEQRLSSEFDAEYEVLGVLGDHRGETLSGTDIAHKLNVQPRHVDTALRQLASENEIEHIGDDEYRMPDDEPSPARQKAQERSKQVNSDSDREPWQDMSDAADALFEPDTNPQQVEMVGEPDDEPSLADLRAERQKISDQNNWDARMGSKLPPPPDTAELDRKISKAEEREGKKLWQRPRDAVKRVTGMPVEKHRKLVEDALKRGKDVPAEVLADYPDLKVSENETEADEPKRRMQPVTFRHKIGGSEQDVTVKSHLEYKGHKIVNPHKGSYVVLDADGNKVTEMAGVGGATRYLDNLETEPETSDEPAGPQRPRISASDVDYQRAMAAHAGISMVPDERAKQEQQEYVRFMESVWDGVSKLAESPEQQEKLQSEFARFQEGYLKKLNAHLDAKSRTLSPMVTGPSNFPTRRNQKRNDTERRRLDELLDYSKKAQSAMRRNIANAATPEQREAASNKHLHGQIERIVGTMKAFEAGEMRGSDPALFKQNFVGRFATAARDASPEAVQSALEHLEKLQSEHLKKPVFTKRHKIWKFAEHAKNRVEAEKSRPAGTETVHEVAGHSVERDHDDGRVRIYFDGKPAADVRQSLKSAGWRWSPRNKAWQRMNTNASVSSAQQILAKHFGDNSESYSRSAYELASDMMAVGVERYGQGSLFDEKQHPRADDGRFSTKEGDKPPKKPGVQGMQMGLFDEEPSGQKTLFNVSKPSGKKKSAAKSPAQLSLLEQITDAINKRAKEMAPSLEGQKTMFSRPGEPERYADMPGQRDLMTGQERRSSKTQGKFRWVTIGGHPDGESQHAGGNAVLIDGDGNIVGGNVPKEWQGKHVGDTHKFDDNPPEGVPLNVKQMNNGRWYAMGDLPDGDKITRSHTDREAAVQAATNDIQRRGHQVREQTAQERAGANWSDPPIEVSPGLNENDARIERETQERARREYPQLRDQYAKLMGSFDNDGNLKSIQFNTDEWRGLFPEYKGTNAHAVHEASSYLNKRFLAEALETMKGVGNNSVLLLAGGGGSGKGSATKDHLTMSEYPIVIDQVSDKLEKSHKAIDQAKANGYSAEVAFVDRHPEDAWRGGVVPRAVNARKRGGLARTVPLDVALKANIDARNAALELLKSDPDAKVSVINNNVGPGLAYIIKDRDEAIDFLESQNHNFDTIREKLANETRGLHERGVIPDDIAQGLLPGGAAPDGRVQPGRVEGGDRSGTAAESPATGSAEGTAGQGAAHRPAVGGSGSATQGVSIPGEFGFSTAGELKRDPERFQYKLNTNKSGVTDQFKDVKYNPMFGGVLQVWKDPADGNTYVVNGHHRHELAERSGYGGQMPVYSIEADSPEEARAAGALVNMAGGNGTAVDAAKFLRDSKMSLDELNEIGVSVTKGVAKDAGTLSKLSPRLFDRVATGLMRQGRAIAIAEHVDDHDSQERIAKQIESREDKGGRSISDTIVGEIARQNALSSRVTETQGGLFGEEEVQRDLDIERADLITAVRRQITNRLNKFKAVANDKAAETLEGHNTIDAAANRQESKRLTGRLDDFDRESSYRGAVSDIINRHAEALADEPKRRNEIVGQLAAELESHFTAVPGDSGPGSQTGAAEPEGVREGSEGSEDQERHRPLPGQQAFFSRALNEDAASVFTEAIHSTIAAAFRNHV